MRPADIASQASLLPSTEGPRVELHHGDCIQTMSGLTANAAAMAFCDVPYNVTRCKWDIQIDMDAMWKCLNRAVSSNGAMLFSAVNPFASRLISSNLAQFKYDLVWEKSRPSGFLNAARQPLRCHELILLFSFKATIYHPQMLPADVRKTQLLRCGKAEQNTECYGRQKRSQYRYGKPKFPRSVLQRDLTSAERGKHPTQKPVNLIEWLIRTYTNEGDTVLDPVFGSGTTAIACLRTGRNFVGIEKDATYFEAARKRIAEEQARLGFAVTV